MKYLTLVFLFLTSFSFAQNKTDDLPDLQTKNVQITPENTSPTENDSTIQLVLETPPSFPGGHEALTKYISQKTRALNPRLSGTVFMRATVETNGTLSNVIVTKNIPDCSKCREEGINIVKSMPKFSPGKNRGKSVRSYFNILVKFD